MSRFPQPYPVYIEPVEFRDEFDSERSPTMAQKYFEWFRTTSFDRLPTLFNYFSLAESGSPQEDLQGLGLQAVRCIGLPWALELSGPPLILEKDGEEFAVDAGPLLTPNAVSLGMDLGIFVAKKLLDLGTDYFQWKLVTKPKNDFHFQSPVVQCGQLVYSPKSAVNKLYAALRNKNDGSAWAETYAYAVNRCKP